jgi:hypothetical protein
MGRETQKIQMEIGATEEMNVEGILPSINGTDVANFNMSQILALIVANRCLIAPRPTAHGTVIVKGRKPRIERVRSSLVELGLIEVKNGGSLAEDEVATMKEAHHTSAESEFPDAPEDTDFPDSESTAQAV